MTDKPYTELYEEARELIKSKLEEGFSRAKIIQVLKNTGGERLDDLSNIALSVFIKNLNNLNKNETMKQYLNILQGGSIKEYFSRAEDAFEEIIDSDHKIRSDYIGTIALEINDSGETTLSIESKEIFKEEALDHNKEAEIAAKKLKIKELQKEVLKLQGELNA